MKLKITLVLFILPTLIFAQDLSKVRKRLTELGSYSSVLRYEKKDWSYTEFLKKTNSSNGAFLRENPRPKSEDIKKDLLQEVFYLKRLETEGVGSQSLLEVKDRLYKTLSWWLIDKPQFRWTDSALDQPRYVGTILLLMFDTMKEDEKKSQFKSVISRIRAEAAKYLYYTWNFGRADDRFLSLGDDLAADVQRMGNVGYRLYAMTAIASALDREDLMDAVSEIATNQLVLQINTGQNHPIALMPDFAFHQHNHGGGQLYNLGYGLDWFNDFVGYSYYVNNTKWAFKKKELETLANFLVEGIYPFFLEKGQLVQQSLGRHNQVQSTWIKFPESRAKLLRSYFPTGSSERKAIDSALSDLKFTQKTGFHTFYTSDFLIADLPNYSASLRMVSDRTSGQESGDKGQLNGMQNFFSADGSFILYSEDFDQVKGAWDWRKVPGTTTGLIDYPLPFVPYGKNYGGFSSYAGAFHIANGALLAGNLRRKSGDYQLEIVKSYLLLKDLIVFWGFGLKYTGKEQVHTTITQERWSEGAFIVTRSDRMPINLGQEESRTIEKPTGIWNNGQGYVVFPVQGKKIILDFQAQSIQTKWKELDQRNNLEEEMIPLFTASIRHMEGQELFSDAYFYVTIPSMSAAEFGELFEAEANLLKTLEINNLTYSNSSFVMTHDNTAWFVNFKKSAESHFSLSEQEFTVSGLIGGAIEVSGDEFILNLTQMEKKQDLGQDFTIRLDNFTLAKEPIVDAFSQSLKIERTRVGTEIKGNTATKNPLNFGSTFRFNVPKNNL